MPDRLSPKAAGPAIRSIRLVGMLALLGACAEDRSLITAPTGEASAAKAVFALVASPSELAFRSAPATASFDVSTDAPKVFASVSDPEVCSVSPSSVNTRMVAKRWGDLNRIATFQVTALKAPGRCSVVLSDGRNVMQQVPVEVWRRLGMASITLSAAHPVPGISMMPLTVGMGPQGCLDDGCGSILFDDFVSTATSGQYFDLDPSLRVMEQLTNGEADYLFATSSGASYSGSDVTLFGSPCGGVSLAGCSFRSMRLWVREVQNSAASYTIRADVEILGFRPGD